MVAITHKRIHCVVIAVPADGELLAGRGALAHEMVPGADPYVAQLIAQLQDEVRFERRMQAIHDRINRPAGATRPRFEEHQLRSDLEIPWFDLPQDDEPLGDDVPEFGDANDDLAPNW